MTTVAKTGFVSPVNGIQSSKKPVKVQNPFSVLSEKIKKQKELKKLEEQYKAGEISKFEYVVNKTALLMDDNQGTIVYSTTARGGG
ncbi:MAG: hypothetical protein E7Z90_06310 [Cyanobacteria bacterium SIG29]|nr:hypothetical protein [Cyanobacteria bacterium SIG29]